MVKYVSTLVFVLATSALVLVGCSESKDEGKSKTTKPQGNATKPNPVANAPKLEAKKQWYVAELKLKEGGPGTAFFFLQVPQGGAEGKAIVRTGEHEMDAGYEWKGDQVVIPFPLFHTKLIATRAADGVLKGTWQSESRTWGKASMDFKATPIDAPTVAALRTADLAGEPNSAFNGLWKLAMADGAASVQLTVKPDGAAVGMFNFPSGSHLHIGGVAAGDKVRLGGFDGTSAYVVTATLADKALQIDWAVGQDFGWKEQIKGERVESVEFEAGARMIQGADNLEIADFDVETLKGKPTIVELAGSWCITCKFIAPFLVEIYKKYHPKGLEMVTLTYEFTDDDAYNKKASADFKRDYSIPWNVIPMMGGLDDAAEILPLTMEGMELGAFPYSIFLTAEGKVQHIHAGFPASGSKEYESAKADYEKHVEALLASAKPAGKSKKKK